LMKQLGYGRGYAYDHDAPDRFSGQNYFPDGMERETYYEPTGEGEEAKIKERLEAWAKLRAARDQSP
jgi:putative ATPase